MDNNTDQESRPDYLREAALPASRIDDESETAMRNREFPPIHTDAMGFGVWLSDLFRRMRSQRFPLGDGEVRLTGIKAQSVPRDSDGGWAGASNYYEDMSVVLSRRDSLAVLAITGVYAVEGATDSDLGELIIFLVLSLGPGLISLEVCCTRPSAETLFDRILKGIEETYFGGTSDLWGVQRIHGNPAEETVVSSPETESSLVLSDSETAHTAEKPVHILTVENVTPLLEADWTQDMLAAEAHVHQSTIAKWLDRNGLKTKYSRGYGPNRKRR
jgi:hypothetical protein